MSDELDFNELDNEIEVELESYYIEFFVTGVIKVNSWDRKQKVKKIQRLLNKIVEDEALDLVKSDSNLLVMSESEVIQNMTAAHFDPNEDN